MSVFDHFVILVLKRLKVVLINMVASLMMSAKLAVIGLLKIKVFQTKGYDVIISVYDVARLKLLLRDLNYIADVVMLPKFDSFSIPFREVIKTSIL